MHWKRGDLPTFLTLGTILIAITFGSVLADPPLTTVVEETESLSEGPWPSFGNNNRNTRLSPYDSGHVDGTIDWTYHTDMWLWSSPAIGSEGVTYFGSPNNDLYALNVENGSLRWSYSAHGDILSSPAISLDEVIYFGSGDHNIYALNSDGTLKWTYPTEGEVYSSPTVDEDGNVYVGSYDGNLYSVDPEGNLNWKFSSDSWLWSSPAIGDDGAVYVGSGDENLYAIDMENGTELWNFTTNGQIYSSPAVDEDGTIYFGSYDGNLYALNPDGTLRWNYYTGARVHPSPAVGADGTIYIGSHNGNFYAVKDGEIQWIFQTGDRISSSAALSGDGLIYFGSYDGNFYALDVQSNMRWSYDMESTVYSSPAINKDGRVLASDWNGRAYAFTGSDYSHEISTSVKIAGKPGNSVTAILKQNDETLDNISLLRTPGKPNRASVDFNYSQEQQYTLTLIFEGNVGGNPVNVTFKSGFGFARIFNNFVAVKGQYQEVVYDLNEEIGDMVSRSRGLTDSISGDDGHLLNPKLSIVIYDSEAEYVDVYFYDLSDDSEIGNMKKVASGDIATVSWNGLKPNTRYGWYAVARIHENLMELGYWNFSTAGVDHIKITKEAGGAPLKGGYVLPGNEERGYLSAYNNSYGFLGTLKGDWNVAGGNARLNRDGHYRDFSGLHAGNLTGNVFFNATYDSYSYSVRYTVIQPLSERVSGVPREINIQYDKGVLDLSEYIQDTGRRPVQIRVNDPNVEVIGYKLFFNQEEEGVYKVTIELEDEIDSTTLDIMVYVGADASATQGFPGFPWVLVLIPIGLVGGVLYVTKFKYTIEDIFLIHDSGVLIKHTSNNFNTYSREDILAGMFIAVNNFIRDAFGGEEKNTLKKMEYGDKSVLVHKGEHVILAVFVSGRVPSRLLRGMSNLVKDIESRYEKDLEEWSGNIVDLPGITGMLELMHGNQGKYNHGNWEGHDEFTLLGKK
ncbi:MAG: PQQ-binding-like beta-propeller repeat protein [Thermoplasmata archaeon]